MATLSFGLIRSPLSPCCFNIWRFARPSTINWTRLFHHDPAGLVHGSKWTDEELDQVKSALKEGKSLADTHSLLPGRTLDSVKKQRTELRRVMGTLAPTRRRWTATDNDILLEAIKANKSVAHIANILGRTEAAIQTHVKSLPIAGAQRHRYGRDSRFTPEEDAQILSAKADGMSWPEIQMLIPRISTEAVAKRYLERLSEEALKSPRRDNSLRSKKWTPLEDEQLRTLRDKERLSWVAISERIPGRAVRSVARRYLVITPASSRTSLPHPDAWSNAKFEELKVLRAQGLSSRAIAQQMGTTKTAVLYGLHRVQWQPPVKAQDERAKLWSSKELDKLKAFYLAGNKLQTIAQRLGRSYSSVRRHLYQLRLKNELPSSRAMKAKIKADP